MIDSFGCDRALFVWIRHRFPCDDGTRIKSMMDRKKGNYRAHARRANYIIRDERVSADECDNPAVH